MTKNYQRLWQGVTTADDEAMAVRALAIILVDKEGRAFVSRLVRKDAEFCIDILDRGIKGQNLNATNEKQAFLVTLRRLAGLHGRLAESMMIAGEIEVGKDILASGGFADVRMATYKGHLVAVKALRVAATDDIKKIRKQFCKEAVLWSTLSHPHVLKLVGVYGDMEQGQFSTVSEWMANGNIVEYVRNNSVNRLQLLHGAAQGLKYIHMSGLTHGDLKGANILMSNDNPPRACLADFGFMAMVLDPEKPLSCSAGFEGGTLAFMSPELLMPTVCGVKNSIPTQEADIYAFALVIVQVLTGELPFRDVRPTELGYSVVKGLRPEKPENASAIGFSDPLWSFVQRCWGANWDSRPKVSEVVRHLAKAAASWHGLMPPSAPRKSIDPVSEPSLFNTMNCRIFEPQSVVPESPTDSRTTSELFSDPGSPSTIYTEPPPQDEPPEAVVKPTEPPLNNVPREPSDDHHDFHHVTMGFQPPPMKIPPPQPKPFQGFKAFKAKFREFFRRLREPYDH